MVSRSLAHCLPLVHGPPTYPPFTLGQLAALAAQQGLCREPPKGAPPSHNPWPHPSTQERLAAITAQHAQSFQQASGTGSLLAGATGSSGAGSSSSDQGGPGGIAGRAAPIVVHRAELMHIARITRVLSMEQVRGARRSRGAARPSMHWASGLGVRIRVRVRVRFSPSRAARMT